MPGSKGLATSEPEIVESQGFPERSGVISMQVIKLPLSAIIRRTSKIVQEAIGASAVPDWFFHQIMSDVIQEGIDEASVLYSYITVQAFCYWNRTSWSVVAQPQRETGD